MTIETNKVLFSGTLGIEYGQFYIDVADDEDEDDDYLDPSEAFQGQENGICGAAQAGKLFFVTGIQNGTIAIRVELHAAEPPIDRSYEEVVEVPLQIGKSLFLYVNGRTKKPINLICLRGAIAFDTV